MRMELRGPSRCCEIDLPEGMSCVGGGAEDDVQLPGAPAAAVELLVEGPRLTSIATLPMRVGAGPFPAFVPRLVLPGEALEFPDGHQLRRPLEATVRPEGTGAMTAAVVQALLRSDASSPPSEVPALVCVGGPDRGAVFPIAFAPTRLGRGRAAQVRLSDPTVARRHACILADGAQAWVCELSASRGLWRNGLVSRGRQRLEAGDLLELGHSVLAFRPGRASKPQSAPAADGSVPSAAPLVVAAPGRAARAKARGSLALAATGLLALAGAAVAAGWW